MRFSALVGRRWLPITALVLAGSALCARLGIWQLDRLAQRQASNARISHAMSLAPLFLPATEEVSAQEYRAVHAQGVFDFDHQMALRNQARGGEYGYHLLTPLVLHETRGADPSVAVLVDRGWIPASGNAQPADWRKYDLPGVTSVIGVMRLAPDPATSLMVDSASAAADPLADRFTLRVDPQSIPADVGYVLPDYYIQAAPGEDANALPAPETISLDLGDGPHLGYAIQWFGFALALLIGYGLHVRKQEAGAP